MPFVGDPAEIPVEHNPKPTTARGRRRSQNSDEYQQNMATRQAQSCPCAPTQQVAKGPAKRSQHCTSDRWREAMGNYKKYTWVDGLPS